MIKYFYQEGICNSSRVISSALWITNISQEAQCPQSVCDDKYASDDAIIYKQQHHPEWGVTQTNMHGIPKGITVSRNIIIFRQNSICRSFFGQSLSCNFPAHLRKIGSLPNPKCNVPSPLHLRWNTKWEMLKSEKPNISFILMCFSISSFACRYQLIILKWSYLYHLFFTQIHIIAHLNTGLRKISLPPSIPFQKHKILRVKICKVRNKSCQDQR